MNKAKKTLAAITATVLSASSFFCTNLTAFAETDETDRSLADSLTIDECIDYVNEMNSIAEQNAPEVGIYATPISKEEGEILQRVLENDYYSTEGFDYTYKYQKYDFSSEYYYDQLPSHLKKAYAQLDKACSEFLTSSVNLSSGVFQTVMFDSPLASEDELLQLYRCFYYSNPQYFFLGNGVSYYTDYSGIALKTYDNCQNASKKATIKNSIDSLTDSYINSVSSLSGDVAKETAIAKKISDLVDYDLSADYNQSMMSALYYNKSVCNGYAMSMNYFCNALGIECITVTSTGHAWNRVKLNGEWYEVDVTWYDQTDNSTKYWDIWLNKSTATFLANDDTDQHIVETDKPMYSGITLPSCTDDDPSDNVVTVPAKPANVTATAGNNQVTLTWDAVPGATKYAIAYQNGSSYTTLTTECTSTTYTATGLTAGKTYSFLVQAYANGQWSTFTTSDLVSATPTSSSVAPSKPTNVKATAGNNQVTLSWDAVPGATKYAIAYYNNGSFTTLTLNCTSTTYTATGLTAGKTYSFLVQAYANGQWSTFTTSDLVSATPTSSTVTSTKPTNVTATAGTNSVTLNWTAVPGATKYAVAYYNNGKYTTLTLNCTSTTYTATGLTAGKTYQFLVQANVGGQWSPFTTADHVSATPTGSTVSSTKPANVTATAGNNQVTLSWDAVPGATKYAIAYYNNGSYTTLTLNCTSTTYTATGLTAGKTYQFLVQANVGGQWSTFTTADHVSATPTGSTVSSTKPTNVTATAGTNSVTLSWTAVPGATKYAIAYYNNGSYTTLTLNCTSTNYTATGLTAGKTYQFLVQANVGGQWSPFTTADHVSATPTGSTVSSTKPANVTATAGNNQVTLSWDAVPGATKYAIAYYNNGSYTTLTLNCTSTTYTATGLTAGKTYQFLVQANVGGQWSPFTSADHVSATPTGSTVSSTKPTNVTATAGTNSATLSWTAVPGATRYAIAYYNGNSSYTTLTLNCTSTTYTATGLTAGKTYQFLVQANVSGQWSPFTTADHVSATPTGSTVTSTKPTNVTATAGTNSVTLSWTAVPGATKYAIAYYNSNGCYTTLTLNCTSTTYTATGLTAGKTYQFLVQANVSGQWSPFTTADHVSVTVN